MSTVYNRIRAAERAAAASTVENPNIDAPESGGDGSGDVGGSTWDQAAAIKAAQLGITLPADFKETTKSYGEGAGYYNKGRNLDNFINDAAARVQDYANNPQAYYQTALKGAGLHYQTNAIYNTGSARSADLASNTSTIQNLAQNASRVGVSYDGIQSSLTEGQTKAVNDYNAREPSGGGGWFDKAFALASVVGVSAMTAGLGSAIAAELGISAIAGNALASVTVSLAQGQDARTAITNAIASAGGQIAGNEFLQGLQGITDPKIANVLANSVKYGTEAAIKGQDINQALIAGAGAGVVSQAVMKGTEGSQKMSVNDRQDMARAAGAFVAARKQGLSTEQALAAATAGFAVNEITRAKQDITNQVSGMPLEQVNALSQQFASTAENPFLIEGTLPSGTRLAKQSEIYDATSSARYDPELNAYTISTAQDVPSDFGPNNQNVSYAGSGAVMSAVPYLYFTETGPNQTTLNSYVGDFGQELPMQYSTADRDKYEVTKQEGSQKFPLKTDTTDNVLMGYINQTPGLPGVKNFGYVPKISQQASSQALQSGSGDIYSPYLESKEGGKRKNVWNKESLKTTDELGSTA